METNLDRLKYLKEKIRGLNNEINNKGLEDQFIEAMNQVASGELKIIPVSEEIWDVMLPMEQEENLLAYYLTFRSEMEVMIAELNERKGFMDTTTKWLENKWVKRGLTSVTIGKIVFDLIKLGQTAGLFFREEEDVDYLT